MHYKPVTHFMAALCVTGFILSPAIYAFAQAVDQKLNAAVSVGYFTENFRWSIAGDAHGKDPNIYSELRWKKLRGPQSAARMQYHFWKGVFVQAYFSYASVTAGHVTDTDFGEDNRKDTLYHDSFDSDKGSILNGNLSLGYQFKIGKIFSISPFAGYGITGQSLYILRDNGNVFGDLRSTYKTRWNGFTLGCDLRLAVKKITINPLIVYHQVNYAAKANWNLIEEFKHPVSFRHKAKGFGIEPALNLSYLLNKHFAILLNTHYGVWRTGKGSDTLYRTDNTTSVTQMNGARTNHCSLTAGVKISF